MELNSLSEKIVAVRDLLVNKSKKDPPTEPYKSKYEAKDILLSIEDILKNHTECENKSEENELAVVYYLLGSIYFDVDEPSNGTEYTNKAVKILSDDPIDPHRIICYVSSLNILGFAACKYDKIEDSLQFLQKAQDAYNSYNEKYEEPAIEFCALFGKPIEDETKGLDKAHTSTLFYLAQVYSTKGDRLKSAKFCHTTLKRQLELKEYEAVDWALNSATLSQYLIEKNAFKEARNHLATAQILLEKQFEEYEDSTDESEEVLAMKETLRHRIADIFRCWAKYGIYLMNTSKDRLVSSEGDSLDPIPKPPEELQGLAFSDVDEEKRKEYEAAITSDFILTFEDAKPVFLTSQKWLDKAKEYYTLEDHASDYVTILQDSSQLYQLLAFYQSDEATQCKLHKRRLDMLDAAVNGLNPQYYMNVCRELWYELGEIGLVMADIKRSQGEEKNDQHFFTKSQHLYKQGIKYFEKYLESFNLKNRNGTIEKYPDGFEKSIIMTNMFLGRMYSKLTSQEKDELVTTQRSSLHYYRTVLEYCNVHKEMAEAMPEELAICREMAQLIPLKITKIERYM